MIKAYKGVSFFTPGTLLVAQYGSMNLTKHTIDLHNTAYRMAVTGAKSKSVVVRDPKTGKIIAYHHYQLNYWGHAKRITQTQPKHYVLKDALTLL